MKAAYIEETGNPSVIQYADLPDPLPGKSEVLIEVGAVAVNPIDTYIRSGAVALDLSFPYIIGCDLAGTVLECGSSVTRYRQGDRVWCSNQGLFGRVGSFSELAAVNEEWLYPTPHQMSDVDAAASALVGITAHLGLFKHGHLQPDEIVFVNGGTGGVGSSVVQLAKAARAKVIATVGTSEKQKHCETLGADLVLNYNTDDVDSEIQAFCAKESRSENPGVDLWFETLREPTLDRTVELMSKRGRMILMAGRNARPEFPVGPFYVKDLRIIGFAMFNASTEEQRLCAESINGLVETEEWQAQIGKLLPLSSAADAHALQEQNTLQQAGSLSGKIVLQPASHFSNSSQALK